MRLPSFIAQTSKMQLAAAASLAVLAGGVVAASYYQKPVRAVALDQTGWDLVIAGDSTVTGATPWSSLGKESSSASSASTNTAEIPETATVRAIEMALPFPDAWTAATDLLSPTQVDSHGLEVPSVSGIALSAGGFGGLRSAQLASTGTFAQGVSGIRASSLAPGGRSGIGGSGGFGGSGRASAGLGGEMVSARSAPAELAAEDIAESFLGVVPGFVATNLALIPSALISSPLTGNASETVSAATPAAAAQAVSVSDNGETFLFFAASGLALLMFRRRP